jgi:hypothetical protein
MAAANNKKVWRRRRRNYGTFHCAAEWIATPIQRSYNQRSISRRTLGEHSVINMFTF